MKPFVNEEGWTLIELIGTLSILGLLVTLAFPQWVTISQQIEEEMFLQLFALEIYDARMQAIAYQQEVAVEWQKRRVVVRTAEQVLRSLEIPDHLQIESNYAQDRLLYRRSGQAVGGTIWLKRNQETIGKLIVQVASGVPRVVMNP
jgi:Tfp pilus assembly protein FimT